jgi:hypothetical protein
MARTIKHRSVTRAKRDHRANVALAAIGEHDVASVLTELVESLTLQGWTADGARAVVRAILANAPVAELERLTSCARRICAERERASRAAAADPSRGKVIDFQDALRSLLAERAGTR